MISRLIFSFVLAFLIGFLLALMSGCSGGAVEITARRSLFDASATVKVCWQPETQQP